MFRERYNGRQQALFHVLAAYSIYNSEVGYCQGNKSKICMMIKLARFSRIFTTLSFTDSQFVISGMSQIAALLLMYLIDEEDAFWALSQIMVDNKYAMHGKYK